MTRMLGDWAGADETMPITKTTRNHRKLRKVISDLIAILIGFVGETI